MVADQADPELCCVNLVYMYNDLLRTVKCISVGELE